MTNSPNPNRLVVMAAFDPDGELGPHVRHQILAWGGECRRLILVTTSRLSDESREWLAGRAELIERENYGYDFFSYRTGLRAAGDLTEFEDVVICNDTYVGPLRPYSEIFAAMAKRHLDFWGLSRSERISPHVQSFFVVFRRWVVGSSAFTDFWEQMTPESNRRLVIHRYEIGLSKTLQEAGFRAGSYFNPTQAEQRLGRARVIWWAFGRQGAGRGWRGRLRSWRQWAVEQWNPMSCFADSALDAARLPVVKLDTLRYDPYGLDSARLLAHCQAAYPEPFAHFDDYLERTAAVYQPRKNEILLPAPVWARPLGRWVRYR